MLLHALPIFHVHGLFVALHCVLLSGAPMLWLPQFDEDAVLAALPRADGDDGRADLLHPPARRPALHRARRAAHMRLFISGSAPLLESTFAEFEARTGQRILERYGMSEAAIITTNPLHGERLRRQRRLSAAGRRRCASAAATRPASSRSRGPSVTAGYWRNPEKTAEAFTADGFFITGDVGRLDADGRLWLSGRANDLIISGGLNVYPKEIELVLDELAGVVESAVIGVPHPDFGEAVVAVVAGAGDEAAMIAACRERAGRLQGPQAGALRRRPAAQRHGQGAEGGAAPPLRGAVRLEPSSAKEKGAPVKARP